MKKKSLRKGHSGSELPNHATCDQCLYLVMLEADLLRAPWTFGSQILPIEVESPMHKHWWCLHVGCYARHVGCYATTCDAAGGWPILPPTASREPKGWGKIVRIKKLPPTHITLRSDIKKIMFWFYFCCRSCLFVSSVSYFITVMVFNCCDSSSQSWCISRFFSFLMTGRTHTCTVLVIKKHALPCYLASH
jgi:hypothetical protein